MALTKYQDFLAHHGVKGQKWGVQHGPPYPLKAGATVKRKKKLPTVDKVGGDNTSKDYKDSKIQKTVDKVMANAKKTYEDAKPIVSKDLEGLKDKAKQVADKVKENIPSTEGQKWTVGNQEQQENKNNEPRRPSNITKEELKSHLNFARLKDEETFKEEGYTTAESKQRYAELSYNMWKNHANKTNAKINDITKDLKTLSDKELLKKYNSWSYSNPGVFHSKKSRLDSIRRSLEEHMDNLAKGRDASEYLCDYYEKEMKKYSRRSKK